MMEGRSEGEILDRRWHFSGGTEVGKEKWVGHRWDFNGWRERG